MKATKKCSVIKLDPWLVKLSGTGFSSDKTKSCDVKKEQDFYAPKNDQGGPAYGRYLRNELQPRELLLQLTAHGNIQARASVKRSRKSANMRLTGSAWGKARARGDLPKGGWQVQRLHLLFICAPLEEMRMEKQSRSDDLLSLNQEVVQKTYLDSCKKDSYSSAKSAHGLKPCCK